MVSPFGGAFWNFAGIAKNAAARNGILPSAPAVEYNRGNGEGVAI